MKKILFACAVVLGTAALSAQEADRSKRIVEGTVKNALVTPPPGIDLREATGLTWHEGLEAVANRGKPVVLLQLLGRFDDVFC